MSHLFAVFTGSRTRLALSGAGLLGVGLAVAVTFALTRPAPATGAGSGHPDRSIAIGTQALPSTSPVASSSAAPSPSQSPSPSPGQRMSGAWPGPGNTGVPAGWTPATTYNSDLRITAKGAVVQDVRIVGANLVINADDVTVRRVELQGGSVLNDSGAACRNGLVLEDVSIVRAAGKLTADGDLPAVQAGGYTARRVKIDDRPEGFRVGGRSEGCGPVTVVDSFARVTSPDKCTDWHGDGLQGYDGAAVVVRNVTLEMVERGSCGGTAPFFYPDGQGNTSAQIDGLLVKGGGYPFRLTTAGSVHNLRVVDRSWGYGPAEVNCAKLTGWDAQVVTIDAAYQPTRTLRTLACPG